MGMPARNQLKYWGIAAAVVFGLLYLLGDVILPFVLGMAVAYLLDPIADRLEALGLGRVLATLVITLVAAISFLLATILIVPTLIQQALGLLQSAPDLARDLYGFLIGRFPDLLDADSQLSRTMANIGETISARGGELLNGVITSAAGLLNMVILLVLVPVITFYLLLDWDRLVAQIDALLPRDHAEMVRGLARDIDHTLASFIRGQGLVCLILGTFYAISLMLVGLNFGLVVGAVAGFLTFIPYVGVIVGGALAIGLALVQFWGDGLWIAVVVAIFVFGQFVEGNILTPKLVGSSVGLHPVWLLFALAAFGTLFGFVGMLVAVPVAAAIGVIARFGIERYRASLLYLGVSEGGFAAGEAQLAATLDNASDDPPAAQSDSGD